MHRRRMGTMASLLKGGKSFLNYAPHCIPIEVRHVGHSKAPETFQIER